MGTQQRAAQTDWPTEATHHSANSCNASVIDPLCAHCIRTVPSSPMLTSGMQQELNPQEVFQDVRTRF
jgi:hypothetical protein